MNRWSVRCCFLMMWVLLLVCDCEWFVSLSWVDLMSTDSPQIISTLFVTIISVAQCVCVCVCWGRTGGGGATCIPTCMCVCVCVCVHTCVCVTVRKRDHTCDVIMTDFCMTSRALDGVNHRTQ